MRTESKLVVLVLFMVVMLIGSYVATWLHEGVTAILCLFCFVFSSAWGQARFPIGRNRGINV